MSHMPARVAHEGRFGPVARDRACMAACLRSRGDAGAEKKTRPPVLRAKRTAERRWQYGVFMAGSQGVNQFRNRRIRAHGHESRCEGVAEASAVSVGREKSSAQRNVSQRPTTQSTAG